MDVRKIGVTRSGRNFENLNDWREDFRKRILREADLDLPGSNMEERKKDGKSSLR